MLEVGQTVETKDLKAQPVEAIKDQDKVVLVELKSQVVMLKSIKARMDRVTREAMSELVEVRVQSRLTDRTGVLRFLEAKILLLAPLPKSLDVVTVTRMALDSASRVIATVNPSTASSPGW